MTPGRSRHLPAGALKFLDTWRLQLAQVMCPFTPTTEELPSAEQLIVDGTSVSCWSW
jgi:hypothetical protein